MKAFASVLAFCLLSATSVFSAGPLFGRTAVATIDIIPAAVSTKDSVANFISTQYGLDAPQVANINATSFDWWYFDVVSADLNTSLVVVFYTALDTGFPFLNPSTNITVVGFYASFPNGTLWTANLDASEAIVTTFDQGSSGYFEGTGAGWSGTPDMSVYTVAIDSPANGIVGVFTLRSVAPAHYPCGPAVAGVNMKVGPNIGWSNAMPDADGTVDFVIAGTPLAFTGIAYHDKNWGTESFGAVVASWYWGHARLGAYSLVWFDFLGMDGVESVSAYVSRCGQIVTASCAANSTTVRPMGVNSQYPPSITGDSPGGFALAFDLGAEGTLRVNVTAASVILQAGTDTLFPYTRFTGGVVGSVDGGAVITGGVALYEQFALTA